MTDDFPRIPATRSLRRAAGAALVLLVALSAGGCGGPAKVADRADAPPGAFAFAGPDALVNLHLKLSVDPDTGTVTYLGWYDGRRNLLGPGGISTQIMGMEPPDVRGALRKVGPTELRFAGVDQNRVAWEKVWRLDDTRVDVVFRITNRRDDPFDAVIFSIPDMPDARVSGDNRDLHVVTPTAAADFHAFLDDPNFVSEQFNPYGMRSESKRLEPGESMELRMTWTLRLPQP